ncbi:MAG: galactokinase [Flammeovirgaceae bacterium]|nr:galactokinase [Flammeovirgaceae bacterium]HCX22759.1 galactokinase [Cytophagales bacterium]|tara:strand:- start:935 stop:2095 length:1161 start_codon:yes stop_codon:yes gene_type:complete
MNEKIVNEVKSSFEQRFGIEPIVIKAPGRINLIGEHTDYNNGFVLPAAVDQAIYLAIGKSGSSESTLVSLDMDQTFEFSINDFQPTKEKLWANYLMGVVAEIQKSGREVTGFNIVFSGDVPQGSGMSSSAALECGTCFALNELFDLSIPKVEMVKMSQKAEHNYAGVMCGIMDQFASMMGSADHALLLDCESLEYRHFPIELTDHIIVLCNSNVSHNLADSEYNIRRKQCEEGVSLLQKYFPEVKSLRDVSLEELNAHQSELSDVVYKRCKYVIEENERVMSMTKAMEAGEIDALGEILTIAQEGMRSGYEISCPEIDFMADFANNREDVVGARMMGGGFGGCTINLVNKGSEDQFISELNAAYKEQFNKEITPIKVVISDGVKRI